MNTESSPQLQAVKMLLIQQPWFNKLDPLYWLSILFSYSLLTDKYQLRQDELVFIFRNISKHRLVLWVNLIGGVTIFYGLSNSNKSNLDSIISLLIAPSFITGGAWFAVTFGGVPQKLLDAAMVITFWMFSAFTLSLTTMTICAYYLIGGNIAVLTILLIINFAVIIAATLYDSIDGLRIGLDESLKANSLATLRFLKKYYDITPPKEGQALYDDLSNKQQTSHKANLD